MTTDPLFKGFGWECWKHDDCADDEWCMFDTIFSTVCDQVCDRQGCGENRACHAVGNHVARCDELIYDTT